jgi:pimeloyl-ACP methyl ester carboxylesterase
MLLNMSVAIARPKLEGNVAVGDDRQISFAEFGAPWGRAVFWLHGTPGARRQIPTEARVYAEQHDIRLIGVDRPGIGSSTPYRYENILGFADDLRTVADTLGIDKMAVVGLSGGGPYSLACGAALPDRVVAVAVLGGVAPTQGPEAISGGAMNLGLRIAPLLKYGGNIASSAHTSPSVPAAVLCSPGGLNESCARYGHRSRPSHPTGPSPLLHWAHRS